MAQFAIRLFYTYCNFFFQFIDGFNVWKLGFPPAWMNFIIKTKLNFGLDSCRRIYKINSFYFFFLKFISFVLKKKEDTASIVEGKTNDTVVEESFSENVIAPNLLFF